MSTVDIHADDYCISSHSSEDILKCLRKGNLNSISIITNMSCYKVYAEKFLKEAPLWPKQPKLSIHLNFMEGHCLAEPGKVPHLVDEHGYFHISWGTLFYGIILPKNL